MQELLQTLLHILITSPIQTILVLITIVAILSLSMHLFVWFIKKLGVRKLGPFTFHNNTNTKSQNEFLLYIIKREIELDHEGSMLYTRIARLQYVDRIQEQMYEVEDVIKNNTLLFLNRYLKILKNIDSDIRATSSEEYQNLSRDLREIDRALVDTYRHHCRENFMSQYDEIEFQKFKEKTVEMVHNKTMGMLSEFYVSKIVPADELFNEYENFWSVTVKSSHEQLIEKLKALAVYYEKVIKTEKALYDEKRRQFYESIAPSITSIAKPKTEKSNDNGK